MRLVLGLCPSQHPKPCQGPDLPCNVINEGTPTQKTTQQHPPPAELAPLPWALLWRFSTFPFYSETKAQTGYAH